MTAPLKVRTHAHTATTTTTHLGVAVIDNCVHLRPVAELTLPVRDGGKRCDDEKRAGNVLLSEQVIHDAHRLNKEQRVNEGTVDVGQRSSSLTCTVLPRPISSAKMVLRR